MFSAHEKWESLTDSWGWAENFTMVTTVVASDNILSHCDKAHHDLPQCAFPSLSWTSFELRTQRNCRKKKAHVRQIWCGADTLRVLPRTFALCRSSKRFFASTYLIYKNSFVKNHGLRDKKIADDGSFSHILNLPTEKM